MLALSRLRVPVVVLLLVFAADSASAQLSLSGNPSGARAPLVQRGPEASRIGDTVYSDDDGDGQRDLGEPGIPGVTVTLACAGPDQVLGTADDSHRQQVTDGDGHYLFTGVLSGISRVAIDELTLPPGTIAGPCPTTFTLQLGAGESFLDAAFCVSTPGEIGDTVFSDEDHDGAWDPGEPGIPGVLVYLASGGPDELLGTLDDLHAMDVTDGDGLYLFTNVPPGPSVVEVDVFSAPPGKVPGGCPTEFELDLAVGESFLQARFCFETVETPPSTIGGTIFCDEDGDGFQDPGEPGIPGALVTLFCTGPDQTSGTSDDETDSQLTDDDGQYLFTEQHAGFCRVAVVEETLPPGLTQGGCPTQYRVHVVPGESFLDADFCYVCPNAPGEIGDTVFCDDLDDDGVQDPGEPGIPGVLVDLVCAGPDGDLGTDDDIVSTQATDGDGHYLFTNVPPGPCVVTVDVTSVPPDKVVSQCPTEMDVDLEPSESFLDADFCFVTLGAIGDTVFCDEDDDGYQDPGEPGIPGVTVLLTCAGPDHMLGTNDDVTDSRVTDGDGHYLFGTVPPGLCEVEVDVTSAPAGKTVGQCPTSMTVSLDPGEIFLDADFCFVPVGTGEGCTPGYWKQSQHFDSWAAPYTPGMPFSAVFEDAFPGMTLVQVVSQGGGGLSALGRHTVAALLNAQAGVQSGFSTGDVIGLFNEVFPGTDDDYEDLKDIFEASNEQGCPLN